MSTCPNCHQAVTSTDDICENCGAVLVPLAVAPNGATSLTPSSSSYVVAGVNTITICPNCKQPVSAGEEICENCGAVLAAVTAMTPPITASTPVQETCPQCQRPRTPGVKFCNRCGYRFATETSQTASSVSSQAHVSAPTTQLVAGSLLNGKYKIVKEIGAGGMGAVYLADDQVLKRRVVIKALLSEDDPDLVAQSVKEREFLAAIKHANIVSIYDFITMGTRGYIVMEYVQGKTLEQIMEEQGRPFDVQDAIKHIIGILPAFSYLAKLGLVYCDFKPQNVMLEVLKDGTQVVKLIDLGTVIKYIPKPEDVYGTHGFYAPEAVKNPSPETDLYSICRSLAYMVTLMDLANPIFGMPSIEDYRVFRDYPALYRLLVKGTARKPEQRFHSAEELSDQLAGVLRLIVGGKPGVPVSSRLFVSSATTTTGKFGPRAEVALDENDKTIDLLRYGDQALRSGKYSSALGLYRQVISSNLHSVDAHLRLAEVFIEQGEFAQARAELARAQRITPGNWKVTWYTARLFEAQGDLVAAADTYQELINDLPGELPPLQALARVRAKLGDDAVAVTFYNDVLRADPGNTDAVLGLTDSLLNLQRWDEATRVLSGVSEAAAKYVDAQLLLCDLYLNRIMPLTVQNIEQASHAIHALEGRTEDARYYLARGDVYRAAWQLARAHQLPAHITIAGVSDSHPRVLGAAAEESYRQYLRREQYPADREVVVRRALEVAPWRLW
ncbi:MAG TPA: tetratricopeptide repeat protein [Ktedonobacteraceae bacterium]|nr:tetratricopeptide repeat protein [Ktedonobacteraceae bacterium]